MPIYMCRWENGDISFVSAVSKDDAIGALDEVGAAISRRVSCHAAIKVVVGNAGKPRTKGEYRREVGFRTSSQLADSPRKYPRSGKVS